MYVFFILLRAEQYAMNVAFAIVWSVSGLGIYNHKPFNVHPGDAND